MEKEEFEAAEDVGWDGPRDWRGNEIGVFTKVIGFEIHGPAGGVWRIGQVVEVGKDSWGHWLIDVRWSESSSERDAERLDQGRRPWQLTVFREGPN